MSPNNQVLYFGEKGLITEEWGKAGVDTNDTTARDTIKTYDRHMIYT